jgi:hypothetical protein
MIVFTHRPCTVRGWEFESDEGHLNGGGRTLAQSKDSSEHAARQYLTRTQGYEVLQRDALYRVDHVIRERVLAGSARYSTGNSS